MNDLLAEDQILVDLDDGDVGRRLILNVARVDVKHRGLSLYD